jgi:ParB family chromosome partitioning protein
VTPTNPREDFDEAALDRLGASMKARGQLQPVRVRWDSTQGKYVMIAGERRWRAAQRAGIPAIAAIIQDGNLSPADLLAIQVTENALRENLKPIEQAKAYRRLMDLHGWNVTELAREVNISQASASRALALLNLPEAVQEHVEHGTIAPSVAHEVSQIKDPDAQAAVADQAVSGKLRGDELRALIEKEKAPRREVAMDLRHVVFRAGGFVITATGSSDDPALILQALHGVISQLKK